MPEESFVQSQIRQAYEKEQEQEKFISDLKSQVNKKTLFERLKSFSLKPKAKQNLKQSLLKSKREKTAVKSRASRTKETLQALGVLGGKPESRKPSPAQLKARKLFAQRMKKAREQGVLYNRDMRGITSYHDLLRARMLLESRRRNEELSPQTRLMLDRLREVQTRGLRKDDQMQRVLRERRIIQNATDILRTPSLFDSKNTRGKLDFTGVDPSENILFAPNVFKERPDNKIMRTGRPNILQTKETGNNLFF